MAITERYASSAGAGAKDGAAASSAWDFATMLTSAVAGDRINFLGNHTLTGAATFSNAGSATSPIILRGYASTIGDCSALGRTNGNGPLVTTGMPVIACGTSYYLAMPQHSVLEAMTFTGSRSGYLANCGAYGVIVRCAANNSGTGGSASALYQSAGSSLIFDCDGTLSGGSGGLCAINADYFVVGCRADGGASLAIRWVRGPPWSIASRFQRGPMPSK